MTGVLGYIMGVLGYMVDSVGLHGGVLGCIVGVGVHGEYCWVIWLNVGLHGRCWITEWVLFGSIMEC